MNTQLALEMAESLVRILKKQLEVESAARDLNSDGLAGGGGLPPCPIRIRKSRLGPEFWALVEATNMNEDESRESPHVIRRINRCLKQIRHSTPDVTPEEIHARAKKYRQEFSGVSITPEALAKHWPSLTNPTTPVRLPDNLL